MDRKVGAVVPFREEGELGPHLTQCRLGRGLPRTKWHLDQSSRLAKIDIGMDYRDAGKACAPKLRK